MFVTLIPSNGLRWITRSLVGATGAQHKEIVLQQSFHPAPGGPKIWVDVPTVSDDEQPLIVEVKK